MYKFGIWEQINAAAYLFMPSYHEAMDRAKTRRIPKAVRSDEDNRKIALWDRGATIFLVTALTCTAAFLGTTVLCVFGLLDFVVGQK